MDSPFAIPFPPYVNRIMAEIDAPTRVARIRNARPDFHVHALGITDPNPTNYERACYSHCATRRPGVAVVDSILL